MTQIDAPVEVLPVKTHRGAVSQQHEEPGSPRCRRWSPVTSELPGLHLARKVMTCLSCFPALKDTVNISPSRVRLPWVLNRLMKSRLLPIGSLYSSRDNRCRWQYNLVLLSINKLDPRQLRLSPYNRNILHVIEPNRHAK
jgi:hypothetical protein